LKKTKHNEALRLQIFEVVENQMRDNNPPETNETFQRLIRLGYSEKATKMYIGQCVAVEIFNVLKHHQKFDRTRYITNLKNLPKEPFD
jgi:Domain of unknown function (DUF1841)